MSVTVAPTLAEPLRRPSLYSQELISGREVLSSFFWMNAITYLIAFKQKPPLTSPLNYA